MVSGRVEDVFLLVAVGKEVRTMLFWTPKRSSQHEEMEDRRWFEFNSASVS